MKPRIRSHRTLSRVAGLAVAASLAAGLSACGSDEPAAAGGGQAANGGTLVIDTAFNAKSVDPARLFQPTDSIAVGGVYQTLLEYQGTDVTTPKASPLTTSFELSANARRLTVELNPKARFSDGTPVTAADAVFSFNRLKNVKADPSFLVDGLTVRAKGEHTVVITSSEPRPDMPAILCSTALAVTNARQIEQHGGTDAANAAKKDRAETYLNEASAGSGQYMLESYSSSSEIVLKANPKAWDVKPAYDRIVIRNVPSSQQQLNIEAGESQVAVDLSARQASTLDPAQVKKQTVGAPEVLYLAASQEQGGPTANPKILEAIRKGVNYDALLQVAGSGAKRAAGMLPSSFLGALPVSDAVGYDAAAAKAAVAASGIANPKITLDYANDYKRLAGLDYGAIALRVQSDLKNVGIDVELRPSPTSTSLQRYVDGKIQLALWSYPPDFGDPANLLMFAPGTWMSERVHWKAGSAPAVTAAADKAMVATGDQRQPAFQAWDRSIANGPFIPLLEPSFTTVSGAAVANVIRNPVDGIDLAAIGHE